MTDWNILSGPSEIRERITSGQLAFVAQSDDNQILGCIFFKRGNHCSLLFVRNAHQRSGIGRQLFERCAPGFDTITVNSSDAAVEFYRRVGFSVTGTRFHKRGAWSTPMRWQRQGEDYPCSEQGSSSYAPRTDAKQLPQILLDHMLPFDWDTRHVWALATKATRRPRHELDYLLDLPLWSARPQSGMTFDLTPRAVIEDPELAPHQTERVDQADTSYPIELLMFRDRPWVLDGVHRLARLYREGVDTINVRFHPTSSIAELRVAPTR